MFSEIRIDLRSKMQIINPYRTGHFTTTKNLINFSFTFNIMDLIYSCFCLLKRQEQSQGIEQVYNFCFIVMLQRHQCYD